MPIEGARFIHSRWNLVDTCRPRDMARRAMNNASWALHCIQLDLRHRIGRLGGTVTYLDGRSNTRFHDVIRCDEGGWVHIEDLVKMMEVLWTAQSRQITTTASHTDEDQKKRTYNERVQLFISGNLLGARQRNGKQHLQFLGVRLKDPPAGPYNLGVPGSNMMVSRQDQITELMINRYTRHEQQWLGPCDGWIRPWAVRAVSGHLFTLTRKRI